MGEYNSKDRASSSSRCSWGEPTHHLHPEGVGGGLRGLVPRKLHSLVPRAAGACPHDRPGEICQPCLTCSATRFMASLPKPPMNRCLCKHELKTTFSTSIKLFVFQLPNRLILKNVSVDSTV